MYRSIFSAAAALLALQVGAQTSVPPPESINPTSTYYFPGAPTGAVPGNYDSYLRPQVHFSPPINFMNDPNGMHRDPSGLYHLYYQYNPLTPVAGNQVWGHATSHDLYTWMNQKIAIWPPNNYTYVYSGSAVIDSNNTSGFFPHQDNGVVAMYTLAEYYNNMGGVQYQAIAYSRDGGYTFHAYKNNPVIDRNLTQFRDPYVTWYEPGGWWILVLSHADIWTIEFFTSPNLKDWTSVSNFTKHGLLGVQYECPNFRQMPMVGQDEPIWYLQISINPGAPYGGSISEYFVGDFNGTHFTPYDEAARLTDFAKDNYAGQFFNEIPANEPQIAMDWASNWEYAQSVPTGEEQYGQFRSAMTVPRCNTMANFSLQSYVLLSAPCHIETVFEQELAMNSTFNNGTAFVDFRNVESNAIYFEVNITGLTSTTLAGMANFTISSSISGEFLRGGTIVGGNVWVDRGHTYLWDNIYFTDKFSQTGYYGDLNNGTWSMSMIVDRSIFELFINSGQLGGTATFFPTSPLDTLRIDIADLAPTAQASIGVWGLKSTWAPQANASGIVNGNSTKMGTYMFE